MSYKFNPLTGNFDSVSSGSGSPIDLRKTRVNLTNAESPYAITTNFSDTVYAVNLTGGNVTIELPAVSVDNEGSEIHIYIEVNPNNANVLTINASGADTIRGQTSVNLNVLRDGLTLIPHTYGANHWDALSWERTDEIVYQPGNTGVTSISTLQKLFDYSFSSGQISGCELTDNGDGTIAVSAGEWKLRDQDEPFADCRVYKVNGNASLTPEIGTSYLAVDVNGGDPVWLILTDITGIPCTSTCLQAVLYRDGVDVKWIYLGDYITDFMARYAKSKAVTNWLEYGSGIMVGNPASLRFSVTAGVLYQGTIALSTPAFDSNGADRIIAYYRNGSGGWAKTGGQTDLDNLRYDTGTGTLVNVAAGRYTNFWIYVLVDNPSEVVAVYPQRQFTSLSGALSEEVPTILPPFASKYSIGKLIGRITTRQSVVTAFQNISSIFNTVFTSGTPINHNDLSGRDDVGNHSKIVPSADSSTAFQVMNSLQTDAILTVDTLNQRVGINKATPMRNLDINALANQDATFGLTCDSITTSSKASFRIGQTNSYMTIQHHGAVYTNFGVRQANGSLIEAIGTAGLNICARPITTSEGIKFFTGGEATSNERMRIITNGNIGIGTSTPEQLLHLRGVNPTVRLDDATNSHTFQISNSNGAVAYYDANIDNSAPVAFSGHLFRANGGSKNLLSLKGTGKIGIGIADPIDDLHVHTALGRSAIKFTTTLSGATASDGATFGYIDGGISGAFIWVYEDKNFVVATNNIERMRVDNNGNVGIGVTNPDKPFTLRSTSLPTLNESGIISVGSTDSAAINLGGSIGFTANTTTLANYPMANISGRYETAGAGVYSGYLAFATSSGAGSIAERMRITSIGDVGIGTTNPATMTNYVTLTIGNNEASKSGAIKFRSTYNSGDGAEVFQMTDGAFAVNINASHRALTMGIGWLVLNGFTKLGGDAPAIKHKKLTGTTNAAGGGIVEINHGIAKGKILDVAVCVWYSATGSMAPEFTGIAGYQYHSYHDGIWVYVTNHVTNSENILSKPIKILITYEE